MKKILGIIGAGHLGQQIAHYAISDNHYDEVVFFDDYEKSHKIKNCRVLGKLERVEECYKEGEFHELMVGIGYNHIPFRQEVFQKFRSIPYGKIVHSTSWIDPTAVIGDGVIVYPSCTVDANVVIKENVLLNLATTIAHDSVLHEHSFVSPNVALAGFVTIGAMCVLGINSTVIDSINIAEGIRLGGGTVVIKNLNKKGLYVGNPARYINKI